MGIVSIVILIIVIALILYVITLYNRFQQLKNGAEATLKQIRVTLKRRLNLISQLVDTVIPILIKNRDFIFLLDKKFLLKL